MTLRERLELIRQQDYLSLGEAALLLHVSKATIRRRVLQLPDTDVLRDCRVVRVRRVAIQRAVNLPLRGHHD